MLEQVTSEHLNLFNTSISTTSKHINMTMGN